MKQFLRSLTQKKPRLLALSTYPVNSPKDGGQIRAAAEREALGFAGFDVTNFVVGTDQWPRGERGPNGFWRPSAELSLLGYPWVCWDLALGREHQRDSQFREALKVFIAKAKPDVVVLDQPWLWPIYEDLMPNIPLVYSSQNVEHRLKQTNLEIINIEEEQTVRWRDDVLQLELAVLEGAGRTVAVSSSDAAWMMQHTRQSVPVAPNGTHHRESLPSDQKNWSRHFDYRRSAVFVASGHPPNAIGFWDMLAPNLSFLEPEHVVVAVGSVGPSLLSHSEYVKYRAVNNARLVVGGFQPDSAVSAIIANCHAIILPITYGEGSNLKTAEALLSGKPLIGTSRSFRGFEDFKDLSGIIIADDRQEFRRALTSVLKRPLQQFHRPEAEALVWSNTLKPLILATQQLVGI